MIENLPARIIGFFSVNETPRGRANKTAYEWATLLFKGLIAVQLVYQLGYAVTQFEFVIAIAVTLMWVWKF